MHVYLFVHILCLSIEIFVFAFEYMAAALFARCGMVRMCAKLPAWPNWIQWLSAGHESEDKQCLTLNNWYFIIKWNEANALHSLRLSPSLSLSLTPFTHVGPFLVPPLCLFKRVLNAENWIIDKMVRRVNKYLLRRYLFIVVFSVGVCVCVCAVVRCENGLKH